MNDRTRAKPQAQADAAADTRWERTKSNVKTIGGAVLLALFIRVVLVEAFEIDGPSMLPTLYDGDRVVVAKYPYGLFPAFFGIGGDEALITWGLPSAGDVVIVHSPADNIDIVKRVIGVPGDRLEMRDDVVYRNGQPLLVRVVGPCQGEQGAEGDDDPASCEWIEEHIGDHHWHTSRSSYNIHSEFDPVTVPPGHVFVMGDHRDRSNDSRNPAVGMIPDSRVKGRALVIYWSYGPEEGPNSHIRWDRIFQGVE
jgi:signal peptidase I